LAPRPESACQLLAYSMLDDRTGTKTGNWTPYAPGGF